MWKHQLDELSAKYRVIAIDIPGFGNSPLKHASITLSEVAGDIMAAIDEMLPQQQCVVMGLSMGGYVAWELLSRYPDRFVAAVMCDTRAAADSTEAASVRRQMADRVLQGGTEGVIAPMLYRLLAPKTLEHASDVVKSMKEMLYATAPLTIAAFQLAMADRYDFHPELTRFTLPILLVVGRDDVLTTPAEMQRIAESLPDSEIVVIPEAGHMAPLEQPKIVNQAIDEFLSRRLGHVLIQ
jgi:pimeloyl-ACP methyl ester carboxylesterase